MLLFLVEYNPAPKFENDINSVAFVCEVSEKPAGGVQLRIDASRRQHVANLGVVVLQKQPQQTKTTLQTSEIFINKKSGHVYLYKQVHGMITQSERIIPVQGLVIPCRVFEREPQKRADNFVVALLVGCAADLAVKSEQFFKFVHDFGGRHVANFSEINEPGSFSIGFDHSLVSQVQITINYASFIDV
jgi:hypothetical protein